MSVTTVEQTIKLKRWDKIRALELLGRHLGMWNERVNVVVAPIFAIPKGSEPAVD